MDAPELVFDMRVAKIERTTIRGRISPKNMYLSNFLASPWKTISLLGYSIFSAI